MHIESFSGRFTETNGYLIAVPDGSQVLVDAPDGVAAWLARRGVKPDHLLLTHQHFDHVVDAAAVRELGAVVHAWVGFSAALTLEAAARQWGLPVTIQPFTVDRVLEGEADLELCGLRFGIAHVPGHSPDSITFHDPSTGVVFCGDTLFAGSIGRTDLPGGNHQQLLDGIRRHLLTLPPPTRLLPGHGPPTTVAAEDATNPFLH